MSVGVEVQRRLVTRARDLVRDLWPTLPETHACLYQAVALQGVIQDELGVRTQIQAGTCQWPFCRPEEDDGVRVTHFSYQWNGLDDEFTRRRIASGLLPELHAWVAIMEPPTIVDPTTGTWPERARSAGFVWTSEVPPDWIWVTEQGLDQLQTRYQLGVRYVPDLMACMVAHRFAAIEIYPRIAEALGLTLGGRT